MNKRGSGFKARTWLMAALLAAFMAGCGDGDKIFGSSNVSGGTIPGAPPGAIVPGAVCTAAAGPTIPTVTLSDPTNGNQFATTSTTGVAGGGKLITATFSLAMDAATIITPATTFTLVQVAPSGPLVTGTVALDATGKIATLTTSSALLAGTSYTAVIMNTVTSAGTPMGCTYAWNFKTVTPAATGLPPPILGLATPFAIASAAGITTTLVGATINGDAVLGAPTPTCNAIVVPGGSGTAGFGACAGTPPTISGTVITPTFPDVTTANAVIADLLTAYNSITSASLPGATVLGCGVIGTGGGAGALIGCAGNATLPPGAYISATSSSIGVTGDLTLDGQGNADAVFVFQMPSSTLTTAAGAPGVPGSRIVLIGGAKASNVWWQVGSSATIGTFADFKGNVLADSSITVETDATSCGRMLAGAVTATGLIALQGTAVVSVPGNASAPPTCQ